MANRLHFYTISFDAGTKLVRPYKICPNRCLTSKNQYDLLRDNFFDLSRFG